MDFVTIPAAQYQLGWHYTAQLPQAALDNLNAHAPLPDFLQRFSPQRTVALAAFSIATRTLAFSALCGDPGQINGIETLQHLCDWVNARLARLNLRLPTEDEFEAACSGSLFSWGMTVPDGFPVAEQTRFKQHRLPNRFGLRLNSEPAQFELVQQLFKMGDGGCALRAGDPWPLAWLTLSPSFRHVELDLPGSLSKTLQSTRIRPVCRYGENV